MSKCPECGVGVQADDEACSSCGALFQAASCDVHADRPAVARCVICGRALCEDCDHRRRGVHRCEKHREVVLIQGWAQVYQTGDEIEAQLIQGNLESEGIPAHVFSQKDHAFSVGFGDLSPVRVLVPAFAFEDALAVIRRHTPQEGDVQFGCPECGEAVEPGAERCPACGAALDF